VEEIAMFLRGLALLIMAGIPGLAVADDPEQQYTLDPVHTRVVVFVGHAEFSQAVGTISGSTGTVRFDPEDWPGAQVDVTVPVQRLDLGDAKWNAAALAANLLDAQRHPQARFVSSTVEPVDAAHARACGQLTLRGVTRPLCMDVTFNALKRHPLPPFRRTAGFSATATLSRKAFGITAWPTVIGDAVTLRIEAEAVRGQPRGVSDPVAPAADGAPPMDASPAEADGPAASDAPPPDDSTPADSTPDIPPSDVPEPAPSQDIPSPWRR
jgi:polyisoprenoid-binding protein YceI